MGQRNLVFTPEAWEDYRYWLTQDRKTLKKLNRLIDEACRDPFNGIGKPEPLKENYTGLWSRRVDEKNRLVYAITDDEIRIVGCRFHY
jgi:toxin YoeB